MPDYLQLCVFKTPGAPLAGADVSVTKDGEQKAFQPTKDDGAALYSLEGYKGDAPVGLRVAVKPEDRATGGSTAEPIEFVVEYHPSGHVLGAKEGETLPAQVSPIQKLQATSNVFLVEVVFSRNDRFLAARFFDRTGRTPFAKKQLECEGRKATTDEEGKILLARMPAKELEVRFDGGTAVVPAVHDSSLVIEVRLRFVAPAKDAKPRQKPQSGPASAPHHFPGGEPGADAVGEPPAEPEPQPPSGEPHSEFFEHAP